MKNLWSGSSALSSIDQTLQTIRNEVVRLDSQLSQLTQSMAGNQRQRNQIINEIAKVRLSSIEEGNLLQVMSVADQDAADILDKREIALESLNKDIEQLHQQISQREGDREKLLTNLNQVSQQIVDVEAQVQKQLEQDETYRSKLNDATELDSIAQESSRKVEVALEDMAEKAKPYEADKLFMYLYKRGFGTTEYKAGLFARFMDGRVAKIIKYEDARVNFWNLNEIPKRLEEHAAQSVQLADEAQMEVQQYELDRLAEAGIDALNQKVDGLRQELDDFDDEMEDEENNLNQKLEDRSRFTAGQDDYLQRGIKRLTEALQHQNLQSVHRYVRATASPTDDQLVLELRSVDDQLEDIEDDLNDIRQLHENKIGRLKELEGVRRNFKNSRYDDVRSGFGNKGLLSGILAQFLQGVVTGSDVWKVIQRNQRYRNVGSIPDFGSGGLGRGRDGFDDLVDILRGGGLGVPSRTRSRTRQRQSTWNWPSPRRGGGGFKIPTGRRSSGRRSSGGFKTGGGF